MAAAAWNSGRAGEGIVHCSKSASDSSSVTALPKPKRNSFWVSETALCRLAGLPSAGNPARSCARGSGRTPLICAGSMATPAAPTPWPSSFSVISPPNE